MMGLRKSVELTVFCLQSAAPTSLSYRFCLNRQHVKDLTPLHELRTGGKRRENTKLFQLHTAPPPLEEAWGGVIIIRDQKLEARLSFLRQFLFSSQVKPLHCGLVLL